MSEGSTLEGEEPHAVYQMLMSGRNQVLPSEGLNMLLPTSMMNPSEHSSDQPTDQYTSPPHVRGTALRDAEENSDTGPLPTTYIEIQQIGVSPEDASKKTPVESSPKTPKRSNVGNKTGRSKSGKSPGGRKKVDLKQQGGSTGLRKERKKLASLNAGSVVSLSSMLSGQQNSSSKDTIPNQMSGSSDQNSRQPVEIASNILESPSNIAANVLKQPSNVYTTLLRHPTSSELTRQPLPSTAYALRPSEEVIPDTLNQTTELPANILQPSPIPTKDLHPDTLKVSATAEPTFRHTPVKSAAILENSSDITTGVSEHCASESVNEPSQPLSIDLSSLLASKDALGSNSLTLPTSIAGHTLAIDPSAIQTMLTTGALRARIAEGGTSNMVTLSDNTGSVSDVVPSQPNILLLEGGLANLAALQAGIIQPMGLSGIPPTSEPNQAKTPRKSTRNRPIRPSVPVKIAAKPDPNKPVETTPNKQISTFVNLSEGNAQSDLYNFGKTVSDIAPSSDGITVQDSLGKSMASSEDATDEQVQSTPDLEGYSGQSEAWKEVTDSSKPTNSPPEQFMSSMKGDIFDKEEPCQNEEAGSPKNKEVCDDGEQTVAADKEITESPKEELKPCDKVLCDIKATLSKTLVDALPQNRSVYLQTLVSNYGAELLAVPGDDNYTITCQNFTKFLAMHSDLMRLLDVDDQQTTSGLSSKSTCEPQLTKTEPRKYTGKKRGRKSKAEMMKLKADMTETESGSRGAEPEEAEPAKFSRSGRRLKLRKINLHDEVPDLPQKTKTKLEIGQLVQVQSEIVKEETKEKPVWDEMEVKTEENMIDLDRLEVNGGTESVETRLSDTEQLADRTTPTLENQVDTEVQDDTALGHQYKKRKDYEAQAPYKFFCKQCSFKTKRASHMKVHMEHHKRSSSLWKCSKCPFISMRLNHLRRHEQLHNGKEPLSCNLCSYQCWKEELLTQHQLKKHPTKPSLRKILPCPHCNYKTRKQHLFDRHMKIHIISQESRLTKSAIKSLPAEYVNRVVKKYKCVQCDYETERKEHYVRHMADKHAKNPRPYLCDTCGTSFKRKDSLKQHEVIHQDKAKRKYKFKCYICEKGLRSRAHLSEHLTKHYNTRAYLCEICGASFKTRSVQKKHILSIHKNPDAHPCSTCSKTFNTKFSLARHEKTHATQEKKRQLDNTLTTQAIVLPQFNTETEMTLPEFSEEPVHSLQIELASGEVITQAINQQIIEIGTEMSENQGQTAASLLQQITAQPTMIQTGEATTLLYLNTASL